MILIDKNETTGWSHMVASTLPELHSFAKRVGCNRYSNKRGKNQPHYDVRGEEYEKAVELGAIPVSSKAIIHFLKLHYASGIPQDQMEKIVLFWELIKFGLQGDESETSSESHTEKLNKILSDVELKHEEYEQFGSEVSEHLTMFELVSKVFS